MLRAPGMLLRHWLVTDALHEEFLVGELHLGIPGAQEDGPLVPVLHCPTCDSATCEHCAVVREVVDASEGE